MNASKRQQRMEHELLRRRREIHDHLREFLELAIERPHALTVADAKSLRLRTLAAYYVCGTGIAEFVRQVTVSAMRLHALEVEGAQSSSEHRLVVGQLAAALRTIDERFRPYLDRREPSQLSMASSDVSDSSRLRHTASRAQR